MIDDDILQLALVTHDYIFYHAWPTLKNYISLTADQHSSSKFNNELFYKSFCSLFLTNRGFSIHQFQHAKGVVETKDELKKIITAYIEIAEDPSIPADLKKYLKRYIRNDGMKHLRWNNKRFELFRKPIGRATPRATRQFSNTIDRLLQAGYSEQDAIAYISDYAPTYGLDMDHHDTYPIDFTDYDDPYQEYSQKRLLEQEELEHYE